MLKRDWLKVALLVLIPVNTWLIVLYRLHQQRKEVIYPSFARYESELKVRIGYFREKWGIKEGQRLQYPFPMKGKTFFFGKPPPFGQGVPVLFLNIGWIAYPQVWEPTIKEILKASPSLHLVLLYRLSPVSEAMEVQGRLERELRLLRSLLKHFASPRISAVAGEQVDFAFGLEIGGILLILCDGHGIVRAVRNYPVLKRSPYWSVEVTDWRPKLHKAVKEVLEKFFPKK